MVAWQKYVMCPHCAPTLSRQPKTRRSRYRTCCFSMDAVELLRVQAEYQSIQTAIVRDTGAVLVSPFTQSREPMLSFCKRYSNTSGGICEALVARWIGDHANDVSLWDKLLSYTT